MWDLDHEDNYILSLDGHGSYDPNENIMCLSFSEEKGKQNVVSLQHSHNNLSEIQIILLWIKIS